MEKKKKNPETKLFEIHIFLKGLRVNKGRRRKKKKKRGKENPWNAHSLPEHAVCQMPGNICLC